MQGCSSTGSPSWGGGASAGAWGEWVKQVREGSEQETLAPDWTRETSDRKWLTRHFPSEAAGSHSTCSCSLSHASVSVHTHTQTHTHTHARVQQIHLTMTHVSCRKGVWPSPESSSQSLSIIVCCNLLVNNGM